MRRILSFAVLLLATSVSAQVSNRGVFIQDEGVTQAGIARTLNFVGSSVSCAISGGVGTCTFTAPSVTLAKSSTATSGFAAGAVLRNNGGTLDEYPVTGTGNAVLSAAPLFSGSPTIGNATTAGNVTTVLRDAMSGGSATSNGVTLTTTLPTTLTAQTFAARFDVTTSGSSGQANGGLFVALAAGYTGTNRVSAARFENAAASTGGVSNLFSQASGTIGVEGRVTGGVAGVGVHAQCSGATTCYGLVAQAGSGTTNVGGYFSFGANATPANQAALMANNDSFARPIASFHDNASGAPSTAAANSIVIDDGAKLRLGPEAPTTGTMAVTTAYAEVRDTVTACSWTNAQVVALGATTTGDITCLTSIPAATEIYSANLVVDTAASGPTTLTAQCGDAVVGAPYNNLILAGDLKATAGTRYGDVNAERGASIDTADERPYMPRPAAATAITCRFVSSGGYLSVVTGSTGHLSLKLNRMP